MSRPLAALDRRSRRVHRRLLLAATALASVLAVVACSSDAPGGAPVADTSSSASTTAGVGTMDKGAHGSVADLELSPEEVSTAKAAGAGETVGIVAPLSAEYLAQVAKGAQAAADQLGLKTQVSDYQFDAARGVSAIESFVSQGVKYLVVVLTDPTQMIGAVKAAEAAGVTVVQFAGQQVADEAGGYSVSISDAELGTVAGQVAGEIAKPLGKIKVAILDFPSQPNVIVRADNMQKELERIAPDAQVVARQPGGTEDAGLKASESLLQKYPDLRGILSINDAGAYGAVQAFKGAGRTPANAFVIGIDAESKAKQLIASGSILKATVDTQPYLTGQAAVGVIGKLLAGDTVAQYTTVPVKPVTS